MNVLLSYIVGSLCSWGFVFPDNFVSPAGKGLISWLSCLLCFVIFLNVSWCTSELRVRLVP